MAFDITALRPDEKQLLFKNLVTSDFTMMQGKVPDANDPIWEDQGPPQIMPRKSPFRDSSNVNFLLHNEDEVIKLMPASKKIKLFKKNHVVVADNVQSFQKEIERDREERRSTIRGDARREAMMLTEETESKSKSKQLQLPVGVSELVGSANDSNESPEVATRSDRASSSMNPTVDQAFGLLEDDPAVKELPYKKQFDKYEKEINYEEKATDKRRAETSEAVHRANKSGKKDKKKSKSPKKSAMDDIVAQRDRQFALAKKYKDQVRQSLERKTVKSRGAETQLSEMPMSGDLHQTHSPPTQEKLVNPDLAHLKVMKQISKEVKRNTKEKVLKTNDDWLDRLGEPPKFIVVDGRKINLDTYPDGFDFGLIRGMNLGPNQPLYNYNNMVMEQHIIDENAIVSNRPPFDVKLLYPDNFRDTMQSRFWNNKYRAQQQDLFDKQQISNINQSSHLASSYPSNMNSLQQSQFQYVRNQPVMRETLPSREIDLSNTARIQTDNFKNMNERNNFKNRIGAGNNQSLGITYEDWTQQSGITSRVEDASVIQSVTNECSTNRDFINNYYQYNHKYVKPKGDVLFIQDQANQKGDQNQKRRFGQETSRLSQHTSNEQEDPDQIQQVYVPNYGAKVPFFGDHDLSDLQRSVAARENVNSQGYLKSPIYQQNISNTLQVPTFDTDRDTLRDTQKTDQSTIRPEVMSLGFKTVRPNLAELMGSQAVADGMKPLISPTNDSIEAGATLSDYEKMSAALQQASKITKRGKSTLEQSHLPGLVSGSQFNGLQKQHPIVTMNNQLEFLKIDKRYKMQPVTQIFNEKLDLSQINQENEIKKQNQDPRLADDPGYLNRTVIDEQLSKDFRRTLLSDDMTTTQIERFRQGSLFGNPIKKKYKIDLNTLSLNQKFRNNQAAQMTKNEQIPEFITIGSNAGEFMSDRRRGMSQQSPRFGRFNFEPTGWQKKRVDLLDSLTQELNQKPRSRIVDNRRSVDLEESLFIPVMVNYNQRRRMKKATQTQTIQYQDQDQNIKPPVKKVNVSGLGKIGQSNNVPILHLNGQSIQTSPPPSNRFTKQATAEQFKNSTTFPASALHSNLSFNPGESMHRIPGSGSHTEGSERGRNENDGLKSAGSKYSSLKGGDRDTQKGEGTHGTTVHSRPSQVRESIKDEMGADFKQEYEIQGNGSKVESMTHSPPDKSRGKDVSEAFEEKHEPFFGESLMKYQFNIKSQIKESQERLERSKEQKNNAMKLQKGANRTFQGTSGLGRHGGARRESSTQDGELRIDGSRPATQARDSRGTPKTRIVDGQSSILEKIASKENCRPRHGAHLSKGEIAVGQRARSRAEAHRQRSRQGQSRSGSRHQTGGVRIKNVQGTTRTQVFVKAGNVEAAYQTVSLETGGNELSPNATEPDTALRASVSATSPERVDSGGDRTHGQQKNHDSKNRKQMGPIYPESVNENSIKRKSVLKVKHGEQIRNLNLIRFGDQRQSKDTNAALAQIEDYQFDDDDNSQEQKEWYKALQMAEQYRKQEKIKTLQHAQQYGRCFAKIKSGQNQQASDSSRARFFSQQSPRTRQKISVFLNSSGEQNALMEKSLGLVNPVTKQNFNQKNEFRLGVTGNIRAYGISVLNQKNLQPQAADMFDKTINFKPQNSPVKSGNSDSPVKLNQQITECTPGKKYIKQDHNVGKKNLMFRSKNKDKDIFSKKDTQPLGEQAIIDTLDKRTPEGIISFNSSADEVPHSPTGSQRGIEFSRSLGQVQGAKMQQNSQISQESYQSNLQINQKSKYVKAQKAQKSQRGKSKK